MQRPLILGHRGASAHVLENTMAAFVAARDAGAGGIELDVPLTATGEAVVFHDSDLRRLCDRDERIADMSLEAVRQVRLPGGHSIPTLDEVLDEMARDDFLVNVEIKSPSVFRIGDFVAAVLESIGRSTPATPATASAASGRVLISGFSPWVLLSVRRRAPELATGLLFRSGQLLPLRRAWPAWVIRPSALHPESVLVTKERMHAWKQRGYQVNVWTVNEPDELRRLADLGVDGVITDDPAAARSALDV